MVTKVNLQLLKVKHSEIISFLYLHIPLLCGSWDHQRILWKQPKWKYDSWFSSEVSKLTLARNKLNLSLKYWFLEANVVFWICYGHKEGSKYHLDTLTCQINMLQILLFFGENNTYTTLLGPTCLLIHEIFPSKPDFSPT